ncbi:MAG: cupin domain-containing protein [Chloroflexi bacterium]|nr:MAG: cupin domain-containing protein [Chloroflexota bacterium]
MTRHISVNPEGQRTFFVLGDIITIKLTGAETNGKYSMVEIISQPGGGPSFLHTHPPQETFHILEGTYEIYGQDESGAKYALPAPAGSILHVGADKPHGFKNVGDTVGTLMAIYEPADIMIGFFEQVGIPMKDKQSLPESGHDMEKVFAVMQQINMTLIEQPPGA